MRIISHLKECNCSLLPFFGTLRGGHDIVSIFYCACMKGITLCNCLCSSSCSVCMKGITLCNCLRSSSCCVCIKRIAFHDCLSSFSQFPASRVWDFGIVNRSWFCKSYKMADRGGEYSFLQDTHVTIDKRINISSSKRHMATNFTEHVHLQELTQMRLIKQVLVTPWRQDHVTN